MRLAWYAGASTALAAAVVINAFHQRANFYSAMVHLSQSNLSIMILINLILLVYISFMYGLQRLCFGPLRPVEIEQLYEKGWFAVTETCLAMTIFREEVGAFFIVMFTALLTGKVWGWIGEGRVEILEQQPPANPRLFHARLTVSLVLSILYDLWMLQYATRTVILQARPNMMVMFLFEFGILLVCSAQTALRYVVSLAEQSIIKTQTRQGLEDRRKQIREQREAIVRRRELGEATEEEINEPLPDENDVEEMDIEVPGWEAKGHYVLFLDLCADFLKLAIYTAFFVVLLRFYGLPIHIMRDLFMTTRSFVKRLGALLRYRQAIKDLNKYPDASEEDLSRENTCIICREEMHPWDPNNAAQVERSRPKKLPCGHILHFGCLKSWLERQQVCPTCRRSVVIQGPEAVGNNRNGLMPRGAGGVDPGLHANPGAAGAQGGPINNDNNQGHHQQQPQGGRPVVRMFNLGPLRLGFAQGGAEEFQEMVQRLGIPQHEANQAANNHHAVASAGPLPHTQPGHTAYGVGGTGAPSFDAISAQLRAIEERIQQETLSLRFAEEEAQVLRLLLQQIEIIRQGQAQARDFGHPSHQQRQEQQVLREQQRYEGVASTDVQVSRPQQDVTVPTTTMPITPPQQPTHSQPPTPASTGTFPPTSQIPTRLGQLLPRPNPPVTRHVTAPNATAIPSGSPDLPDGVTIPPGWSLLPLQRSDVGSSSYPASSSWSFGQGATPDSMTAGHASASTTTDTPDADALTVSGQSSSAGSRRDSSSNIARYEGQPLSSTGRFPPNSGRDTVQLFGGVPQGHDGGLSPAVRDAATTYPTESASDRTAGAAPHIGEGSSVQLHHQNGNTIAAASKGKAKAVTVEEEGEGQERENIGNDYSGDGEA